MRSADFGRKRVWGLAVVLALAAFCVPYSAWSHTHLAPWGFPLATATLIALYAAFRRFPFTDVLHRRLGLGATPRTWLFAGVVGVGLYFAGAARIDALTQDLQLAVHAPAMRVSHVFQSLNEEILLGFLLLTVARRWLRPVAAALVVATLFALAHDGMYRFGGLATPIALSTTVTLFAVGVLRNCLILATGHIAYAWALHAAWNLTMFAGHWTRDGEWLLEPTVFDLLLGNTPMAIASCVVATGALGYLARHVNRPTAPQ